MSRWYTWWPGVGLAVRRSARILTALLVLLAMQLASTSAAFASGCPREAAAGDAISASAAPRAPGPPLLRAALADALSLAPPASTTVPPLAVPPAACGVAAALPLATLSSGAQRPVESAIPAGADDRAGPDAPRTPPFHPPRPI